MSDQNNYSLERYLRQEIKAEVKQELQPVLDELKELKRSISPHDYYKNINYVMETYEMSRSTLYRLMNSGAIKYKRTKGGKRLIDITTILVD
ncbi:MAG: hypothetical protein N4A35_15280 [Flavobacteriales bacterium]|jgi:hypothetical protein|nr:hypothetical protein [Flavobacteriales bacterium]